MRSKKFFIPVIVLFTLFLVFACSKKQTFEEAVQTEPEEVTPEIPPVEEEPVAEPPVQEEKMPELGDIFFDFDKYNLKDEFKRVLERNARQLKASASVEIVIEGHCDERGTVEYNLALGERRAKAARDYLIALGVSKGQIEIISYGKSRPFDPRHNEEGWAKNRRAHFVIKR